MSLQPAAIEDVYRRRFDGFRNAVAPIVGSYELAGDVVQEAFAQALANRRQFRRSGPLEAWIWKIIIRTAGRYRSFADYEELTELGVLHPERDREAAALIRALPPRRRLVIFLRYFADLSYAEIAASLDISEGTVAATLAQARQQLSETLEEEEHGHSVHARS